MPQAFMRNTSGWSQAGIPRLAISPSQNRGFQPNEVYSHTIIFWADGNLLILKGMVYSHITPIRNRPVNLLEKNGHPPSD